MAEIPLKRQSDPTSHQSSQTRGYAPGIQAPDIWLWREWNLHSHSYCRKQKKAVGNRLLLKSTYENLTCTKTRHKSIIVWKEPGSDTLTDLSLLGTQTITILGITFYMKDTGAGKCHFRVLPLAYPGVSHHTANFISFFFKLKKTTATKLCLFLYQSFVCFMPSCLY